MEIERERRERERGKERQIMDRKRGREIWRGRNDGGKGGKERWREEVSGLP